MKKKNFKIKVCLFMSLFFVNILISVLFAKSSVDYSVAESNYDTNFSKLVGGSYDIFLENLKAGNEMYEKDVAWIQTCESSNKLLIGASGVVWCGYIMSDDLEKLGYDVIGFGGVTDYQITEWLPYIHKKYDKVIIFAGVNTLNLSLLNNINDFDISCAMKISDVIEETGENLLYDGGKVYYVQVKEMTYLQDDGDEKFIQRYNKLAERLNTCLKENNVNLYEIPYPTTPEYSSGYVHYNNKMVWMDMLK